MLVGLGFNWKPISDHPCEIDASIQASKVLNRVLDPGVDLSSNSDIDNLRNVMVSSNGS